jgi:NAD(P)-dependent dehydrogenase (short-subunit alcohol dehydrogenase family)
MIMKGKAALVTGAGSGIGRAIAILFAQEGANVAVNDISGTSAEQTVKIIQQLGMNAIAVPADVAQENEVIMMVERVIQELGGINILVNNAGIGGGGPVLESSSVTWDRVINVNLRGTYLCCRQAGRWMTSQKAGKIVNISSIAAMRFRVNMSAYASAKAGIVNFTRALALEWGPYHINVNCIIPGGISTPMTQAYLSTLSADQIKELIPLGRIGEPEDIARAALFLASDDSSFITGAALPVDGGELTRY